MAENPNKMKKLLLLILLVATTAVNAQYRRPVAPTKNVILMIADGTSMGVISAARWMNIYNGIGSLAIDPWLCGTVLTFSSNAPIGDSAPTTSCYMTGMPSQTGFVSTYPTASANDLTLVDSTKAYQPMATVLEAVRQQQDKATGLVVTVEFPHATPADCAAHSHDRGDYASIASQMAWQNLDVMFGGGNSLITNDIKAHFETAGTTLLQDDIAAFRAFNGRERVWALFGEREMPYDLDRDSTRMPSLQEMTCKALQRLSQNPNGFFLMVEGSKIDWAAHANDAVGCITEYLAFDRAVQTALDFARADGNTTVVVLSDHGNSGFAIGRRNMPAYDKVSLADLFGAVSKFQRTAEGLTAILMRSQPKEFRTIFKEYAAIDLSDAEVEMLRTAGDWGGSYMDVSNGQNLISRVCEIMNARTYFGFTTGGHTGEEVFLAAYHPAGDIPQGMNTNVEINHYLCSVAGLSSLEAMTAEIFAPHREVFAELSCTIDKSGEVPVLTVRKGRRTLVIPAFRSEVFLNGTRVPLSSVVVYVDKTDTFYLPANLAEELGVTSPTPEPRVRLGV